MRDLQEALDGLDRLGPVLLPRTPEAIQARLLALQALDDRLEPVNHGGPWKFAAD